MRDCNDNYIPAEGALKSVIWYVTNDSKRKINIFGEVKMEVNIIEKGKPFFRKSGKTILFI